MIRTYKYKLRLTQRDRAAVSHTLNLCQVLYNCLLEHRRVNHKQAKAKGVKNPVTWVTQSADLPSLKEQNPEYKGVNSQVLQEVVHRVDRTYQNFFRRWNSGLGNGFPRYKSRSQYNSFTHPAGTQCGFDWHAHKIRFPGLGWLRFWSDKRTETSAPGKVKTVTIVREPDDFYVCLTVETPSESQNPKALLTNLSALNVVGIDLGLSDLVVTNTGQVLGELETFKRAEKKIRLTQRDLSRKKRGSHRRAKQRGLLQKQHSRMRRSKTQELHKISKFLVTNHDVVCVEDLEIKEMLSKSTPKKPSIMSPAAKRGTRRNIGLASWGELVRQISYKAESAGKHLVKVDPKGTTQQCSGCGGYPPKPLQLKDRTYSCTHCGMIKPRDENAGINIRQRGLDVLSALQNQTGCVNPTSQTGQGCVASESLDDSPVVKQCEVDSIDVSQ